MVHYLSKKKWFTNIASFSLQSILKIQGIITSGITYYVQGLVLQSKGPVFLTAFNPLCMIITSALGSFLFAEQLHLGRYISTD